MESARAASRSTGSATGEGKNAMTASPWGDPGLWLVECDGIHSYEYGIS